MKSGGGIGVPLVVSKQAAMAGGDRHLPAVPSNTASAQASPGTTTTSSSSVVAAMHDYISCDIKAATQGDADKLLPLHDFDHMYASMEETKDMVAQVAQGPPSPQAILPNNVIILNNSGGSLSSGGDSGGPGSPIVEVSGSTGSGASTEVHYLKELLLLHLDLIQQQSEQLVAKDRRVATLQQENDNLKQRLERMDRRVALQKARDTSEPMGGLNVAAPVVPSSVAAGSSSSSSSSSSLFSSATGGAEPALALLNPPDTSNGMVTVKMEDVSGEANVEAMATVMIKQEDMSPAEEEEPVDVRYGKRRRTSEPNLDVAKRRRSLSSSSGGVVNKRRPQAKQPVRVRRGRVVRHAKHASVLVTSQLYYSPVGEEPPDATLDTSRVTGDLEVPRWRVKSYTSAYSMEGTENLDDEVFAKRHQKLETDEKRRKRWDIQRIREQRQYERLRQRYGANADASDGGANSKGTTGTKGTRGGSDDASGASNSFWPDPDDVLYIHVGETIPVAIFGHPLPRLSKAAFGLPWTHSAARAGAISRKKTRK